ncbi:nucleolar and coiled-body phosphoprotein 1 [Astyanax mexicanus]|uniref:nucleolar and coiled-body phosphoprotein 1 n=1 Tax=Astyanax mexicanus TaxID=7994 RepID=UPI0020CACF73|nr:nucleolar and coiled-body phosphoprotein 1 [Astyanax mexicanus]XP_049332047.1 nucleolar and coiled-body phosphoprotein 1 [Astyanax mexicanus]
MDPLNKLNVMHLQEPLPTALDLSMGCRQIPVRATSVEALDLVKKASQSDRTSGTKSRIVAAPESGISRPFKQGVTDGSQLDPSTRFAYESRYCSVSLNNPNTLPLLNVLPAVALMPSPCPPIDPEDGVEMDKVLMRPSRNPLERLISASQNVEVDSGTPRRTRRATRAGKSALNGLDSKSRCVKAPFSSKNKAKLLMTRRKGFLVSQDRASPTPSLHSTSSVSVISEDSAVVGRRSILRKQTTVETLSSECTFSEANSPCSVEYISSDDSDVVEVPVTNSTCEESPSHHPPAKKVNRERETSSSPGQKLNLSNDTGCRRARRACRANALSFQEIAEILESSEVSSPALLEESDEETDTFISKNVQSTSDAEDADMLKPQKGRATSSSSSPTKKATPSQRKRRSNSVPKNRSKSSAQRKRTKPSPRRKAASGTAKRRRKKRQPSRSSTSMFSPDEPEIKLKYVNQANKEEKKEGKGESFAPYIRMDLTSCTIINFQEDDSDAKAKKGRQSSSASAATGTVPTTSCLQLGRLTSDDRTRTGQLCCLCGRTSNSIGLGDLHGPYCPSGYQPDSCQVVANHNNSELVHGPESSGHNLEVSEVEGPAEQFREQISSDQEPGAPESGSDCRERWIHEDCSIWSAGIFLIKGKLYGLEEAVRLAQETVCSCCDTAGATLGCFFKGCPNKYHFPCALQTGCSFNEENFTIRCPKHKNKSPRTSLSRLQNR